MDKSFGGGGDFQASMGTLHSVCLSTFMVRFLDKSDFSIESHRLMQFLTNGLGMSNLVDCSLGYS